MNICDLVDPLVDLAVTAGDRILEVYATDFDVQSKADDSPLTRADMASHHTLVDGLRDLTPELPIISEEAGLPPFDERGSWPEYWLIDPLDGTKEFVKRNGEFTVNVALIRGHRPVLGIVHAPVLGVTYTGCEGVGATRRDAQQGIQPIRVATAIGEPPRIIGSRSHRSPAFETFLKRAGDFELISMGSSLKFCVVADGRADVYPRLGPTSEWDTGAAQAVVEQAGGAVRRLDGKPLSYNEKADILNPHFVVYGSVDRDWLALMPDAE